jgi:hypothetical protein
MKIIRVVLVILAIAMAFFWGLITCMAFWMRSEGGFGTPFQSFLSYSFLVFPISMLISALYPKRRLLLALAALNIISVMFAVYEIFDWASFGLTLTVIIFAWYVYVFTAVSQTSGVPMMKPTIIVSTLIIIFAFALYALKFLLLSISFPRQLYFLFEPYTVIFIFIVGILSLIYALIFAFITRSKK